MRHSPKAPLAAAMAAKIAIYSFAACLAVYTAAAGVAAAVTIEHSLYSACPILSIHAPRFPVTDSPNLIWLILHSPSPNSSPLRWAVLG